MGKLKSFYHDEIASWDEPPAAPDPSAYFIGSDVEDTCFVLTERDITNGHAVPVQVFTFLADAQEALRLLTLGQRLCKIPEYLDYTITEVRAS